MSQPFYLIYFFYISIWTILFHFLFWLIYGTVIDSGNGLVCIFMFKSSLLLNAKISFCHFLWLFLPFKVVLTIFFSVVKFIHNFYFRRIALPWVWGLYWVFCLAGLGLGLGWVALHRITIIISLHFYVDQFNGYILILVCIEFFLEMFRKSITLNYIFYVTYLRFIFCGGKGISG